MGGWDSTATQGTVIKPSTVKITLKVMQQYVNNFNEFIATKDMPPIKIGAPTGSSAWHNDDNEDKIYGDIDLQVIVPEIEELAGATNAGIQAYWNKLTREFEDTVHPEYVNEDSTPGHPIVSIGDDEWVQVDLMYHTEKMSLWGRYRVTPERGLKGLLHGNMFSVLGTTLGMSIQHSGVQIKIRDNVRVSFKLRKNTKVETITTDIENFVKDIFYYEYENITGQDASTAKLDSMLIRNPGVNTDDIKVQSLINAVKGLARSFELNGMYGKGSLADYSSSSEYLSKFLEIYEFKAMKDINSNKRDKAATPESQARAAADREKILSGSAKVKGMFNAI